MKNKVETFKKEVLDEKLINDQNKKIKKQSKEKTPLARIINLVLWGVLFLWMAVCLIDYFRTINQKNAIFCLDKETIKYTDGNVYSCLGLGYKAYKYERDSYKAIEFGPFWINDRSADVTK